MFLFMKFYSQSCVKKIKESEVFIKRREVAHGTKQFLEMQRKGP